MSVFVSSKLNAWHHLRTSQHDLPATRKISTQERSTDRPTLPKVSSSSAPSSPGPPEPRSLTIHHLLPPICLTLPQPTNQQQQHRSDQGVNVDPTTAVVHRLQLPEPPAVRKISSDRASDSSVMFRATTSGGAHRSTHKKSPGRHQPIGFVSQPWEIESVMGGGKSSLGDADASDRIRDADDDNSSQADVSYESLGEEMSDEEQLSRWKRLLKSLNIMLPHIVLTSIMLVYLLAGAWVLMLIESDYDIQQQLAKIDALKHTYEHIINDTWQTIQTEQLSEAEWTGMIKQQLLIIAEIHEEGIGERLQRLPYVDTKWTFPTALLNTLTLLAACGYNAVTSYTSEGQIFAVVYTMVGIPLMFVTAANIGKVLSELVVYVTETSKKIYIKCHRLKERFERRFLKGHLAAGVDSPESPVEIPQQPQNIWFPVSIYVSGISAYCCLGTFMFRTWMHDWSFMHAFHFGFNLIVTIGLGDILVEDPIFLALIVLFCVSGLAVVTMCIDLASEHLKEYFMRIHYYGRVHKLHLDEDVLHMVEFLAWMRQRKGGEVTWQDGDTFLAVVFVLMMFGSYVFSQTFLMMVNVFGTIEVRDMMESIRRGAFNPREAVRWHWVDGPERVFLTDASLEMPAFLNEVERRAFVREHHADDRSQPHYSDGESDAGDTAERVRQYRSAASAVRQPMRQHLDSTGSNSTTCSTQHDNSQ